MIALPLIYFTFIFILLLYKNKKWNLDLAATSLLMIISLAAIMIDINDIYGDYGINEYSITFPTLILFCVQWTLVLLPLHLISQLPMQKFPHIKRSMLIVFLLLIAISSILMIAVNFQDIKEAMLMDAIDVSNQHYKELHEGGKQSDANYFMFLPNILVSIPFPTLALFLWFYTKSFVKCPFIIRFGILMASIVQAIISIASAGRSAIIYWVFDFFLIYSFFHQYLTKRIKRMIGITATIIGALIGTVFFIITFARFDMAENSRRSPFESLYGYAGQHVNNFCHMFVEGGDSPTQIDRVFPLISKISGKQFDLVEHYNNTEKYVRGLTSVFDTFGAEVYLDLGWPFYISLLILLYIIAVVIQRNWKEISFHRVFFVVIGITFFTHGLFAWPFTGHYTTLALFIIFFTSYCFKYKFKI
ncbi:MAG: hypothetical protein KBS94_01400 [Prevotella sp.]|nr:hypothetical protein [Candidatus Equicola faecalis]